MKDPWEMFIMKHISYQALLLGFILMPFFSVNAAEQNTEEQTTEEAEKDPKTQACLLQKMNESSGRALISQIRRECAVQVDGPKDNDKKAGVITRRILSEQKTEFNPYVITPHRMNYILPVSFSDNINRDVYAESFPNSGWAENIEDHEAKYQLSIKVPLNYEDLFRKGDGLFFAITIQSWWQVYSENISKPFRETNYQPEVYYITGLDWHPFGGNTGFVVGGEHQSNGRSNQISRSWNRVYMQFLYEKDNFAFAIKPWYRIEEDEKEDENDSDGDDNPDINDYMGYFQLSSAYKYEDLEFSMMARQNFATHKGGIELGMTFPLWGKLRGYLQYFGGYGESLVDYNHKQNRIGLGIALTNVL